MTFHNMLKTLSAFTECFDRSSRMTEAPPIPVNCSARIRLNITCQDHLKSNPFTDKWVSWIKYDNPRERPYIVQNRIIKSKYKVQSRKERDWDWADTIILKCQSSVRKRPSITFLDLLDLL